MIRELVRPRRRLLTGSFVVLSIGRVAGLVVPYSPKILLDVIIGQHRPGLLLPLVVALAAAALVQGLCSYALVQLLSKEGQRLIAELRRRVQAHVGKLSLSYYDCTKTGVLVSRIMNDAEGVRNLIGTGLVEFCGSILTAVLALGILLKMSPLMTSITLAFLLVVMVTLSRAFKMMRPILREGARINAEVTGRLTESLGGVRVVKGYHAEEREAATFGGGIQRLLDNVLKTLTATAFMGLFSSAVLGIVSCVVMFVGGQQILGGHMTPGMLFSYAMYMGFLIAPVTQIAGIGTQITEAFAGLDRIREILAEPQEHKDPDRSIVLDRIEGTIAFEQVNFCYDQGNRVLENIDFVSHPGTVTALVGSSGSGKSTIIGLVAAFYRPTSGRITVDGLDLSRVRLDSYRSRLGVVLQDSFLFDGSIRENVAFSRPAASEEEIMQACRIAHVDEFAERFPEEYDTVIGERGVKLSGGQKQRVSIARAVLADPRVLILDEATSSLDSESEAYIQQGLKYLMQGRTTFVIAHRLSTIRQADQILVIDAGRIVERGRHEQLLALQGRYHELYTRQHGLEANLFLAPDEDAKLEEGNGTGSGSAAPPDGVSLIRGQGSF